MDHSRALRTGEGKKVLKRISIGKNARVRARYRDQELAVCFDERERAGIARDGAKLWSEGSCKSHRMATMSAKMRGGNDRPETQLGGHGLGGLRFYVRHVRQSDEPAGRAAGHAYAEGKRRPLAAVRVRAADDLESGLAKLSGKREIIGPYDRHRPIHCAA